MKYVKNVTSTSADFYVYGEIVDEKVQISGPGTLAQPR